MVQARKLWALAALASVAALLAIALAGSSGAGAAPSQLAGDGVGGVKLTDIGDFESPLYAAAAPGRKARDLLFVVEQGGTVKVVRRGTELERPFLDISERISSGGERGLLSIEFHPRYANNGRLYLYFTDPEGDIQVAQMRRAPKSQVRVKPGSMRKVIEIPHRENGNHNGGTVAFGPDDNLYLATGDGGSGCDPPENAQDPTSLLGKLLRIQPRKNGGYLVPGGNPFVGRSGRDEIYSLGLRNPFRFSFDPKTKTIAIGDVGQSAREEIDFETRVGANGANFGWDALEGSSELVRPPNCPADDDTPTPPDNEPPIFEYSNSGAECAVTGGLIVRDRRLDSLYGRLLYADVCVGDIRSIIAATGGGSGDVSSGLSASAPTSFSQGRKRRVYVTSLSGDVFRIDPASPGASSAAASAQTAERDEPASARAGDGRGGFRLATVGSFDQPVSVTGPKGANGLLFVVEQPGTIRLAKNGRKLGGKPFLNIRKRVQSGGERGLLSVAFSPRYAKDRRFYVYFTDRRGDIVVQEYRRSKRNPRDAREDSARTVIKVRHRENPNHNGGTVAFGPDGNLYLATGDGGSGGDPPENAQDRNSLLGKLLRIDPLRKGKRDYTIPKGNPFVGREGRNEIYSTGLRNPFRFSFDRRSGNIAIGDVGQDAFEEIDYETRKSARGANFGWDAFEGKRRFNSGDASPPPRRHDKPILDYSQSNGGCSVIGGFVSRDRRIPSLLGRYVYADLCIGKIRSLVPKLRGARRDRGTGLPGQSGIAGFGEDARGGLYLANVSREKVYAIKPKR